MLAVTANLAGQPTMRSAAVPVRACRLGLPRRTVGFVKGLAYPPTPLGESPESRRIWRVKMFLVYVLTYLGMRTTSLIGLWALALTLALASLIVFMGARVLGRVLVPSGKHKRF
jgi:hypothetical protein